jgi:pentapeptide MXKDX repeat protein
MLAARTSSQKRAAGLCNPSRYCSELHVSGRQPSPAISNDASREEHAMNVKTRIVLAAASAAALSLGIVTASPGTYAQGMAKDDMKKDEMKDDKMKKDTMAKDGMKKDEKKDMMKKDDMKK